MFSYNSFVKFHGKIFVEPQHDTDKSKNLCNNEVCYKGTALYTIVVFVFISQILSDMYIRAGVLQEVEEIMQQYLQSAQGYR